MTTILELVDRISFLAAMPAVGAIFVSLALLLIVRRWQLHALAMAIMYFFSALLYTRVIRPEVAVVKLLIGWMIALTLYMTGRYLTALQEGAEKTTGEEQTARPPRFSLAAGAPLRSLVLLTVLMVALAAFVRFPLPQVPGDVGLACYLLAIGGVFLMGLTEDPFRSGMGLLMFLTGFDLFFGALEPSLVVAGLLGVMNFLVALAVTFLSVTHAAQWESGQ
ncbi:MAG: hypothetical protein JXD18_13540 [Anaerolineae bacterium]|nr:hypothetical protein [Anaerolineae bacterium]